MQQRRRAGIALVLAIVPLVLYASSTGPIVRVTGAPGDATCNQGGCHSGVAENTGGGSVVLTSPGGTSYIPGQKYTLALRITDGRARVYGFQMSARLVSNAQNGQAGTFTQDSRQKVLCDNSILRNDARGCPSLYPVEFVEHSTPYPSGVISVTWTAPATDVGPVTLYVAANAANGDTGSGGDHIYTSTLQLTPPPKPPVIASNGVVTATAFRPATGVAPGTLLEIYGQGLSSTTRPWQGSDFQQNRAPTLLDQVSATLGGKDAYIAYVSPGQVNLQVPDGVALGPGVPLVLKNSAGSSAAYLVTVAGTAPAILAPSWFTARNTQYAVAILPDATFAGPVNAIPGVKTRLARPGEIVVLYGIGFGPVTPAYAAGTLATQATKLTTPFQPLLGQAPATVLYAGLAPGYTGLYQLNLEIPQVAPGDYPLTLQLGGVTTNTGASISVGP